MQEYLLFIDTETSGLPKNWEIPYANNANWPHALQISWAVYTRDHVKVKREDHYLRDNDFKITNKAYRIHGITREFLNRQGEWRSDVLQKLADDLNYYRPLIVGHFAELDYHIAGVEFYRSGMANPMEGLPRFCTMQATSYLVRNPQVKYLRLGQLYSLLFNREMAIQHNAIADAEATADCFFELLKTGVIDQEKINKQQADREKIQKNAFKGGCSLPVLMLLLLTFLLARWL